jgi:hydrogenase maturation protease
MKGEGPADSERLEPGAHPSSILVLGLGNPILGDDGVGWRVANEVRAALGGASEGVEIDCASLGGLSLMERMLGYEHVILIDAIDTGDSPVGHVRMFPLEALTNPIAGHTSSAHDTSLSTALRTAEAMGQVTPKRIDIVAIETPPSYSFSETLTPPVERAVAIATRKVIEALTAHT